MANPGTRFNKVVSVGAPLSSFASLAAVVMLFVYGNLQVQGTVNFSGAPVRLTMSGSTSTSIVGFEHNVRALTATGAGNLPFQGGANGVYATGRWQNPETQTAALLSLCMDVFTAPDATMRVSAFINNENIAGSGSAKYLFKNLLVQKGSNCFNTQTSNSGTLLSEVVGPNEHVKISNSLGAGSGEGLIGDLDVIYRTMRL